MYITVVMNVLELFKGNSHFGNYIKYDLRNHLITQDENVSSTYQTDIKTFNREIILQNKYPNDYFNLIIAYPPETVSDSEIETLFEIIEYFKKGNPKIKYIILRVNSLHRYILKHKKEYHNNKIFDSCKYGVDYKNEITLFTDITVEPKRCMDSCANIVKHKYLHYTEHVSRPPSKITIPPQLIFDILRHL